MANLTILLLAGGLLFICFLVLAIVSFPRATPDFASLHRLQEIVSLSGLDFGLADRLLDDSDYLLLRSREQLRPVAAQLRRDRQKIILLWLRYLREDVKSLWRFRRFLALHGVPVTAAEEVRIGAMTVCAIVFVDVMRMVVFVFGPVALPRFFGAATKQVRAICYLCTGFLSRVPAATLPKMQQMWAQEIAR